MKLEIPYLMIALVKREGFKGSCEQLYEQALRRIKAGKCFFQPCLGTRECTAYFEESDGIRKPIDESVDLGFMVYDVFDLHSFEVTKETKPCVSVFRAVMTNGVIEIPDYDSVEVLKAGVNKNAE